MHSALVGYTHGQGALERRHVMCPEFGVLDRHPRRILVPVNLHAPDCEIMMESGTCGSEVRCSIKRVQQGFPSPIHGDTVRYTSNDVFRNGVFVAKQVKRGIEKSRCSCVLVAVSVRMLSY